MFDYLYVDKFGIDIVAADIDPDENRRIHGEDGRTCRPRREVVNMFGINYLINYTIYHSRADEMPAKTHRAT